MIETKTVEIEMCRRSDSLFTLYTVYCFGESMCNALYDRCSISVAKEQQKQTPSSDISMQLLRLC